ncbi:MAG TPA: acyl carrier protein [Steroidobacteraceae bacterium]|nr:acyl carrier protein [Steroidobacteraceae bacterium]
MSAAEILRQLAAERLDLPAARFEAAVSLREAGIDSLAAIDLIVAIEERLGIRFPERDLESLRSFDDLAAAVERLLAAKHASS